jgi:hypothetical protein
MIDSAELTSLKLLKLESNQKLMPKGGVKGNSGGKKGRSGPPSKAKILGLKELLDEAWPYERRYAFFETLVAMGEQRNMEAIKLLMAYAFGKPSETVNLQSVEAITVSVKYVNAPKGSDREE